MIVKAHRAETPPRGNRLAHQHLASSGQQEIAQDTHFFVAQLPVELPRGGVEVGDTKIHVRPTLKGPTLELSHKTSANALRLERRIDHEDFQVLAEQNTR